MILLMNCNLIKTLTSQIPKNILYFEFEMSKKTIKKFFLIAREISLYYAFTYSICIAWYLHFTNKKKLNVFRKYQLQFPIKLKKLGLN